MILLIEDDYYIIRYLQNIAQIIGATIETASFYKEAVWKIEKYTFSNYIVDIHLPDGNGLDLIKSIRKKNKDANIAIMSFTSDDLSEFQKQYSIQQVVHKPISIENLQNLFFNVRFDMELLDEDEDDFLDDLRVSYEASIGQKLNCIEQAVNNSIVHTIPENIQKLKNEIHKIVGSSGMFGYPEVSDLCREKERKIEDLIKKNDFSSWKQFADSLPIEIKEAFEYRISLKNTKLQLKEIKKQLNDLSHGYAENLKLKIKNILVLWKQHKNNDNPNILTQFYLTVQKLAGSAASFGFKEVSMEAGKLTNLLTSLKNETNDFECKKNIEVALISLENATKAELKFFYKEKQSFISEIETYIYIWGDTNEEYPIGEYEVKIFSFYEDIENEVEIKEPIAIIVDIDFLNNEKCWSYIQKLSNKNNVILFTENDSFDLHLKSIRANVRAFFKRTIAKEKVTQKLIEFSQEKEIQPLNVLIMEDDPFLLEKYVLILKKNQMIPRASNPKEILKTLKDFCPDIIILDINMLDCSGIEIAKIIRQQDLFLDIPIVFLSAEQSFSKKLGAAEYGDFFLSKPIEPLQLVSTIKKLAKKYLDNQIIKQDFFKSINSPEKKIQHDKNYFSNKLLKEKNKRKKLEKMIQDLRKELKILQRIHGDEEFISGTEIQDTNENIYTIQKIIAKGGMGITYLALRKWDKKEVVVKALHSKYQSDIKESLRFLQEAQCIINIKHENIVQGYGFCHTENLTFIVMEYVEGIDVGTLLQTNGVFNLTAAIKIIKDVTRGLVYLGEKKLVHRDIKPENIIVGTNQTTKLVDFGIAKMPSNSDNNFTTDGIILGTVYYLSPEQIQSEELDTRSDIYSLGITFYEMITGLPPFNGNSMSEILSKKLLFTPNFSSITTEIPNDLIQVVQKMVCIDKNNRYQTAKDLLIDLDKIILL